MANSSELTFDAATHTYRYDGVVVPSVTQIISAVGLYEFDYVSRETLRVAAERGTIVHRCIEWYEAGELDESSIDPELEGYFRAWLNCREREQFPTVEAAECRVFSKPYWYAGTVDQMFPGWINDLKTGVESPAHGLQLSAYWLAAFGLDVQPERLTCTYLRRDGEYRLVEYPYEPQVWLVVLADYKWRVKNNCIREIWQ